MESEYRQTPEPDLDKTDRLPVLEGTIVDYDVADDAVPLDHAATVAAGTFAPIPTLQSGSFRSAGVDLPSLAESVRSAEERIARQNDEHEALTRACERARNAETAASQRATALAVDLAEARTALEAEQGRSRESNRALAERSRALETARSRLEEAVRESEHHQSESRTLREALAARDAKIAEVVHSLGERDAQLSALQQEHARVVPVLEANTKSTSQLQAELQAVRADANALGAELKASREKLAALGEQLKSNESEINSTRYDLGAAKIQANSYLDLLRTREWRRGFDQNLFREMDAEAGAMHAGQGALESERDRLRDQVKALEARLNAQSVEAKAERARLIAQLAARDRTLAEVHERGTGDAQRVAELREAADLKQAEQAAQFAQVRAEQAAQIERLQSEAAAREEEMAVLMAHLHEARRPIQPIESDVKRLTEELEAKNAAVAHLEEEDRKLRATLQRTRAALEEREFLIRHLEHSENANASVLGKIQTSIERMGSVPVRGAAAGPTAELSAELIKIDGAGPGTYVLSRRTRIGRAAGCDLQIESSSVSRHHALVVVGPRETVIEDLNSTNGVFVNGRKVVRQALSDGDAVTIGETKFRFCTKPGQGSPEPTADELLS